MRYDIENNVCCIKLSGEIDIVNADVFKKDATEILERENKDLVFDCTDLDFVDSTALGAFVAVQKQAAARGLSMKLKNVKPRIQKLFTITAVDSLIEIA